jgi:PTH1 family peptidyl-tRNA hydrolase
MAESEKLLVVGLGNPGSKYALNRHSIGFMILDELADVEGISFDNEKKCTTAKMTKDNKIIYLAKPLEFMNLSGKGVVAISSKFKISSSAILIVHDEVDFPFARLKLKFGGGHAGHNGLRDIIEKLGTNDFHRLRFGVGRPPKESHIDVADYVLGNFLEEERNKLQELINESIKLIQNWIKTVNHSGYAK